MAKPALDVGLVSGDAQPLVAFYAGVAGLEPLDPLALPNVGTIHRLACGQSLLRILVPVEAPARDPSPSFSATAGIRYLTLEVEDVDAAVAAARALGGRVLLAPFELRPGRRVAQVADPDGNTVGLVQG